ncbi:glycoside hydrolase family 25 protein [Vicingus serpentipes]|uniref:Glycoside hydrolase family 25 protein n=1 Tax=Vicingus serpentipes TaxID=1926625 RepID=A0A5C6RVX6_9FLAO|nr:GH25 family lysozyme [Vicingus serpentipes]TXB66194.1 glycoside hydrolase family 25 protein [Vicingus serpentipes]
MNNLKTYLYTLLTTFIIIGSVALYYYIDKKDIPYINSKYTFGIDVSHYQGHIEWSKVKNSKHNIKFVFIRSSMGVDGKDKKYNYNWINAEKNGFTKGAYHYFRPNEDAQKQFENFKNIVKLKKGNLAPVLDVEEIGRLSKKELQKNVLLWLKAAENHYKIKPILYTGRKFYTDYLKDLNQSHNFPIWIASYSNKDSLKDVKWDFHQFTDKVRIDGIKTKVDGNDFNGRLESLLDFSL